MKKLAEKLIPRIKKPLLRISILLSAIIFMWIGAKQFYNFAPLGDHSDFNESKNGIWLSRNWMREPVSKLPDEVLRKKLDNFKKRGIRYLFPHVCPMDESGHLPRINKERVKRLLAITNEYEGFFEILPWVGGSIATVDLSSYSQRKTWVSEVKHLVEEYDFPGVNVNIEPLEHGDGRVFEWIEELRFALGKDKVISFCGIRPESEPQEGDNLGIWTKEDYERLASLVDQITVMSYDSGRKLPFLYVHWIEKQFMSIGDAVERGGVGKCKILWGIPVYEDQAHYFDPNSENIRTALHGIKRALKNQSKSSVFDGIVIYSGWTIDDDEWEVYDGFWVRD